MRLGTKFAYLLPILVVVKAVLSNTLHVQHTFTEHSYQELKPVQSPSVWSVFGHWLRNIFSISDRQEFDPIREVDSAVTTSQRSSFRLYTSYVDQVVTRFNISNAEEALELAEACNTLFLDIWSTSHNYVDIRLGKNDLAPLLGLLPDSLQHAHTPLLLGTELANAVADTYPYQFGDTTSGQLRRRTSTALDLRTAESNEFFREYRPLSVLVSWMRLLQSLFPSNVQLITVGRSWDEREIYALRASSRLDDAQRRDSGRKAMIVTGGSHAREWISTSTVSYIMYSFITGYDVDSDITTLLEEMDVIFVPTLNPDGYVYSWEYDRLWRKTRQPSAIPFCQGIDMDRSWGFEWETFESVESANPCSENYAGEEPFHSVEAQSFAHWLRNETTNNSMSVVAMLDLHSYSQSILIPYSYSCSDYPSNYEDLEELGQGMSRAIKRTFREHYEVISACHGSVVQVPDESKSKQLPKIQSSGGSPLDWFHHDMGVKYSFQIKLRDTGSYGFLLPPEYIVPSGREILNAVMSLGQSLTSDDSTSKPSVTTASSLDYAEASNDL